MNDVTLRSRESLMADLDDCHTRIAELEEEKVCLLTDTPLNERLLTQRRTIGKQADRIEVLELEVDMWRKHVPELEATIRQTKELVNLYFEGCAADTFDDAVRALRKALGEAK